MSTISEKMQLKNSLLHKALLQLNIESKRLNNVMEFSDFDSIIWPQLSIISPPEAYRQWCCIWDTHVTASILSWIKFYKISIKVKIFFRLLLFSALLLMANQSGNQMSKVSFMLQKTALVAYETKISQNQNHGHFTQ